MSLSFLASELSVKPSTIIPTVTYTLIKSYLKNSLRWQLGMNAPSLALWTLCLSHYCYVAVATPVRVIHLKLNFSW